MFISIFTPTYNRAQTLIRLYDSLLKQTSSNFEWIIVDDGSTDNTNELVNSWIIENRIKIRYFYQENSGKPSAHNKGVKESRGVLFFCVDSDDYLSQDAVEIISACWEKAYKKGIIGILAFKCLSNGTPVTSIDNNVQTSGLRNAYRSYRLKGDTALIYKTDVIKKYAFPIIEDEKFIPEGYLYNFLDNEGELFILRKYLYYCDYREDGYSANVSKLLYDNYKGYALHLKNRIRNNDTFFEKLLDSVRYDAISHSHQYRDMILNSENKLLSFISIIPGYCLYLLRYSSFNK